MPEIVRLSKVLWSERDRERERERERELLRWDSHPQHTAYEADALEADALEEAQLAVPNQGNTRQGQPV